MYAPQIYLAKAQESLSAARLCFQKQYYNAVANRTYYSCAQAAFASLIQKRRCPGKPNHLSVHAAFFKLYRISLPALPRILTTLRSHRDTADYKEPNITRRQALDCLAGANDFVSQLSHHLGRK